MMPIRQIYLYVCWGNCSTQRAQYLPTQRNCRRQKTRRKSHVKAESVTSSETMIWRIKEMFPIPGTKVYNLCRNQGGISFWCGHVTLFSGLAVLPCGQAELWRYILISPTLNLPTLNLPTLISLTKRVFVSFCLLIFECFESVGWVALYRKQPNSGVDRYWKLV